MSKKAVPHNLARRSFKGKYPENTRQVFIGAVEEAASDGFESDLHLYKDGGLVIIPYDCFFSWDEVYN